ncbi:GNAT family N-acetyltransferase [Shinella sumterensis]|nr:helix-turn-helix domain-containing GNAT family N-acetyltransferase [Shinella sumterensis]MCD1262371.1 GNAT family N-acetyltransferase [Shinella sumterensis]
MVMGVSQSTIDALRAASRQLVRQLGFMGGDFAGTELSPSAVHALIEIEKGTATARDLTAILRLEKSSVSRMLRKLVESGDVQWVAGKEDSRTKLLSLTSAGRKRVAAIHAFAREQVAGALERLEPGQDRVVLDGMRLYARALSPPDDTTRSEGIHVLDGYRAGLIAGITGLHALYYSQAYGFGQPFESVVASGLAEFCGRLDRPTNQIWAAMRDGRILGSVAIDGEDIGPDTAHLRWFIVDPALRGMGAGKRILDAALAFVDAHGFKQTHLWTFAGLNTARYLYESRGFVLAEEQLGTQWGNEVLEQRFTRTKP